MKKNKILNDQQKFQNYREELKKIGVLIYAANHKEKSATTNSKNGRNSPTIHFVQICAWTHNKH